MKKVFKLIKIVIIYLDIDTCKIIIIILLNLIHEKGKYIYN